MNNTEASTITPDLAWFKSSYSGAEGGQCVEIATDTGVVHIRDSKTITGPVIHVSPEAWTEFAKKA